MWSPGQLCSKAVLAQMQILILILLYVFVFLCPAEVSVVALLSIGSASWPASFPCALQQCSLMPLTEKNLTQKETVSWAKHQAVIHFSRNVLLSEKKACFGSNSLSKTLFIRKGQFPCVVSLSLLISSVGPEERVYCTVMSHRWLN